MHIIEDSLIAEFLRQTLHMITELTGHGALLSRRDLSRARYAVARLKLQGREARIIVLGETIIAKRRKATNFGKKS